MGFLFLGKNSKWQVAMWSMANVFAYLLQSAFVVHEDGNNVVFFFSTFISNQNHMMLG